METSAHNISNIATPGFKRRIDFSELLIGGDASASQGRAVDFSAGKLVETGNPYDLAMAGGGFFTVRLTSDEIIYTRNGQFSRDAQGRMVDARGGVLQADGDDLVLKGGRLEVLADGAVLEDGQPVGRLDLVDMTDPTRAVPTDGGGFAMPGDAVEPAKSAQVRQGAFEMSNVTTAAEMVSMMAALRRAETGQRLVTVYDDLMGRALSTFGQST